MTPSHRPPDHPNWDRDMVEWEPPVLAAAALVASVFAVGVAVGIAAARWLL